MKCPKRENSAIHINLETLLPAEHTILFPRNLRKSFTLYSIDIRICRIYRIHETVVRFILAHPLFFLFVFLRRAFDYKKFSENSNLCIKTVSLSWKKRLPTRKEHVLYSKTKTRRGKKVYKVYARKQQQLTCFQKVLNSF